MTSTSPLLLMLATSSLLAACTADDLDESDPIDESFLSADGKTDAFGIHERSAEALGILQLVNLAGSRELSEKVGLSRDAVNNIVWHRNNNGRAPDPFNDLVELDTVPFVGQATFAKLLAYAQEHRYVSPEPFDPAICSGPPLSVARLQELTENGTKPLPTGATWTRTRSCPTQLGCTAWSPGIKQGAPEHSQIGYRQAENNRLYFDGGYYQRSQVPDGLLSIEQTSEYNWSFYLGLVNGSTQLQPSGASYHFYAGVNVTSDATLENVTITFTGSCLRMSGRVSSVGTPHTEREVVFLSQF